MVSGEGYLEDEVKSIVWWFFFVVGFFSPPPPLRHFSANAFMKCNIAALLGELRMPGRMQSWEERLR